MGNILCFERVSPGLSESKQKGDVFMSSTEVRTNKPEPEILIYRGYSKFVENKLSDKAIRAATKRYFEGALEPNIRLSE